jgi:pheromone a factor receptor
MQVSPLNLKNLSRIILIASVLLSYRLYRYRREFVRLVAARNTTKSRFIRLFIICIVIIIVYVPYTIWLLVSLVRQVTGPYSWSRVHDPKMFNSVVKAPSYGIVTIDKWGQIATGYVLFFVFGTGSDAYNTYKKTLLACGLGRIWPSLYVMRESGASTPNSFINARTWTSSVTSKAKNVFKSRNASVAETWHGSTRNNSVAMSSMQRLGSMATIAPEVTRESRPSFIGRVSGRKSQQSPVLPLFYHPRSRSVEDIVVTDVHHSTVQDHVLGVLAYAWTSHTPGAAAVNHVKGVRVFSEEQQECQARDDAAKEKKLEDV